MRDASPVVCPASKSAPARSLSAAAATMPSVCSRPVRIDWPRRRPTFWITRAPSVLNVDLLRTELSGGSEPSAIRREALWASWVNASRTVAQDSCVRYSPARRRHGRNGRRGRHRQSPTGPRNVRIVSRAHLVVNLSRIEQNARILVRCLPGVDIVGVSKVTCGDGRVAAAMVEGGVKAIATLIWRASARRASTSRCGCCEARDRTRPPKP
jgi:hypothetical protein